MADTETGSGDFQPNPIYGDAAPQSYGNSTYSADQGQLAQQPAEYEYAAEADAVEVAEDPDANNPFAGNGAASPEQQPPPYSQDPPAAYSAEPMQPEEAQYGGANGTAQGDPEDVVAQMAADNPAADDEPDYGMPQPETAGDSDGSSGEGLFGNLWIRTVYMATALFIASFFAFFIWANNPFADFPGDTADQFAAGYGLSLTGNIFLFFGTMAALTVAVLQKLGRPIPFEKIVKLVVVGFYVGGGAFYFIGGCAVASAWNSLDGDTSYIAGVFFTEETFVGAHAILAGLDMLKPEFLNKKKWRVLVYNAAFLFLGIVGFFAYAVTSTTLDDNGGDNAGPAFITLFYFVAVIPEVLYLVIYLLAMKFPKLEALDKPIVMLVLSAVFAGSCVMLLIGYFIVAGGDFATFITLSPPLDNPGGEYFVGMGFFVLMCGAVISFDMFFEKFVPGYKDGGDSVSDQQAQGMPTNANEPDTM